MHKSGNVLGNLGDKNHQVKYPKLGTFKSKSISCRNKRKHEGISKIPRRPAHMLRLLSQSYPREIGTRIQPTTKSKWSVCHLVWLGATRSFFTKNWFQLHPIGPGGDIKLTSWLWSNHYKSFLTKNKYINKPSRLPTTTFDQFTFIAYTSMVVGPYHILIWMIKIFQQLDKRGWGVPDEPKWNWYG